MNLKWTDFHFILFLFLFFSLVTSNHFLIFNEETVVAVCFISFIGFSFQFFGNSVAASMDERSVAIKSEFHQALLLEQQYCNQVMYEHEHPIKKTGAFILVAKTLLNAKLLWYRHFRKQFLSTFFKQTLRTFVFCKLEFRINQLNLSKKVFQEKWVNLMASEFGSYLLADLNKSRNNQEFQDFLILQSLNAIEPSGKRSLSVKTSTGSTVSKGPAPTIIRPIGWALADCDAPFADADCDASFDDADYDASFKDAYDASFKDAYDASFKDAYDASFADADYDATAPTPAPTPAPAPTPTPAPTPAPAPTRGRPKKKK